MDNKAIERIASADLGADAAALLARYGNNDDAVFFLGRLVWQGEMVECLPRLTEIALDAARGRYARIASVRAVMSIGDEGQKYSLWHKIIDQPEPIDRQLFAELLDWASPDMRSVELTLQTLDRLKPYVQFETTGLSPALHGFIDRFPVMQDGARDQPLAGLVEGLNAYLDREPHIERGASHVAKAFAWLMAPALHAVDRLVRARAMQALEPSAIAVLRKMPALRFWRDEDVTEYQTALTKNVPRWSALNDILYWTSVAETRASLIKTGRRLTEDWEFTFIGHFWSFAASDFTRCLTWVCDKEFLDDQLVALSRCVHVYVSADRPNDWLVMLRAAVSGKGQLETTLEDLLDPKLSPANLEIETEHLDWERGRLAKQQEEERHRAEWIRELKANPDRVRCPLGIKVGGFTNDQLHLMTSIPEVTGTKDREQGAAWQKLIPEFGEEVAEAYRDAAVVHWRTYRPSLVSEGANAGSTPYSLIFGMAGLSIEAGTDANFPEGLTPDDARQASRYLTWELNGFPRWFEPLYRAFPEIVFEAVKKEIIWELENSGADVSIHHILHDILYHAPWLHVKVAPLLFKWLIKQNLLNAEKLRYCINIMSDGLAATELSHLSKLKLATSVLVEQRPRWLALWVDNDPNSAIPVLQTELENLSVSAASSFAQQFVVNLLGDRHGTGNRTGAFRSASHLKALYILMHKYIRTADDIERVGKGAYSPTLRDNAEDGRNSLFNMLSEIPGAETYAALKSLEQEHPDISYRRWMALRARERAIVDSDEPLWTVDQVNSFVS